LEGKSKYLRVAIAFEIFFRHESSSDKVKSGLCKFWAFKVVIWTSGTTKRSLTSAYFHQNKSAEYRAKSRELAVNIGLSRLNNHQPLEMEYHYPALTQAEMKVSLMPPRDLIKKRRDNFPIEPRFLPQLDS
jgi:hypothetical protein